ncbi:MAG: DNA repair exonuclease [Granulosicoccus sp.]
MACQKPYRFVHTADLHLDSPLKSLALLDPALGDLVGNATRRTLTRIVDLCIDESVDALLIAGDLYDGKQKSQKTAASLSAEMRRLQAHHIRVFIIKGNHDAESVLTRSLRLPDNVHIFDGRGSTVLVDERIKIHGVSFRHRHAPDSLLNKFAVPDDDLLHIGIMHTSIDGSPNHDPYAPCALSDLINFGYDYWALGHIHKRKVHNAKPAVVMPGIPQGRHINESGPCSVTLVSLQKGQPPQIEFRAVDVVAFRTLTIDVSDTSNWNSVLGKIDRALTETTESRNAAQMILRLLLTGHTDLAFELTDQQARLHEESKHLASEHAGLWIERLKISVSINSNSVDDSNDDIAIEQLIDDDLLKSTALQMQVDEEWSTLKKLLPARERDFLGKSEAAQAEIKEQLLSEGIARVMARLQSTEDYAD